jgi:hypothetical protein
MASFVYFGFIIEPLCFEMNDLLVQSNRQFKRQKAPDQLTTGGNFGNYFAVPVPGMQNY